MFYKVSAILAFDIEDEATDFYYDCQVALPKAKTINPGQPDEVLGVIILEKCYHDEHPAQPCEIIEQEHT